MRYLLGQALAVDPDHVEEERLNNLISQDRARLWLERVEEFFLDDLENSDDPDEEER